MTTADALEKVTPRKDFLTSRFALHGVQAVPLRPRLIARAKSSIKSISRSCARGPKWHGASREKSPKSELNFGPARARKRIRFMAWAALIARRAESPVAKVKPHEQSNRVFAEGGGPGIRSAT